MITSDDFIDDLYSHIIDVRPFTDGEMQLMMGLFHDYMVLGGMPAVVNKYVSQGNFSGTLEMQRQLIRDYEEDITKYAYGLDKGKIKNIYRHIPVFLAKDNKKFQISKISKGARSREYSGAVEWLSDAGVVNICYCLETVELPLKGNYDATNYKIYFHDTGLLVGALDDEAQQDLRARRNYGTYKGALYENVVGEMLVKQGYGLYFFRNSRSTMEIDFMVRDATSLVPLEVKATNSSSPSLNNIIDDEKFPDVHYGIKLCYGNVGFNGKIYTFPYFLTFLLKRFLADKR